MAAPKKNGATEISIPEIEREQVVLNVVGTSPLIFNRMSEKAKREILFPAPKKNAAEKAASLKHDPMAEFRASPYTLVGDGEPTYLALMASMFKGAMRTAALDLPGATKAKIGRLVYVEGDRVPVWGVPQLFMAVVRSAGIDKTPDVRSRVIVPRWASQVTISYVVPVMKAPTIVRLMHAGGITAGIGDFRVERGAGNYGCFRIANDDDAELQSILEEGGRPAQMKAMEDPDAYDIDTQELLSWFKTEAQGRGFETT